MKVARFESGPKNLEQTKTFLRELCELAVNEGADDASPILCESLPIINQEKKHLEVPPEKRSRHWPVLSYPKKDLTQALQAFQHAVVFCVNSAKGCDDQSRRESLLKIYTIAMKLESTSFYNGYHLALGLAAGNCREVFCFAEDKCQALKKGSPCRHPLKARASMEACGIDVREINSRNDWKDMGEGNDFLTGIVFVD